MRIYFLCVFKFVRECMCFKNKNFKFHSGEFGIVGSDLSGQKV